MADAGSSGDVAKAIGQGCVKTQMRYRRMVGQLAIFDFRISTDVLRSMSF
jgi:hypothetical protein